jgi:hypothetical protein
MLATARCRFRKPHMPSMPNTMRWLRRMRRPTACRRVHRVIVRESRYQPALVGRGGTIGLMQIKPAARGLLHRRCRGTARSQHSLTYAVKYLTAPTALQAATTSAMAYYTSGYAAAKRQRLERVRYSNRYSPARRRERRSEMPPMRTRCRFRNSGYVSRTRCSVLPAMRSIVRSRCSAERGPMRARIWTRDQQRTTPLWRRAALHPGHA